MFVLLSVNHLVASLQPADSWHLPARSRSVQINNHVVFCNQQLQTAHNIPETRTKKLMNYMTPQQGGLCVVRVPETVVQEEILHDVRVVFTAAIREVAGGEHDDGI